MIDVALYVVGLTEIANGTPSVSKFLCRQRIVSTSSERSESKRARGTGRLVDFDTVKGKRGNLLNVRLHFGPKRRSAGMGKTLTRLNNFSTLPPNVQAVLAAKAGDKATSFYCKVWVDLLQQIKSIVDIVSV